MSVATVSTARGGGHRSAARAVAAGAPAGIVGGLAFGAAMAQLGVLPTVATLVGLGSSRAGFAVHMAISAVVGAGFGLMVRRQRCGPSETMFLGAAYGALWWCIGPLTLLPLALGQAPAWEVAAAQREFPSLVGHLLFGVGTALVYVLLHGPGEAGRARQPVGAGTLARGLAAGGAGRRGPGRGPGATGPRPWPPARPSGSLQAVMSPRSDQGIGAALVRGQGYGFVAWVVGELTVLPMLADEGLRWSLARPGRASPACPAGCCWARWPRWPAPCWTAWPRCCPPSTCAPTAAPPPAAACSSAALRGAVAGLLGGAVISQLMLRGAVPEVAERLTGSNGPLAGIAVNLAIGVAIGVSYGLLFRRLGQDVTCALGWGLSYGFLWWVLGPLTLLPALLGGDPEWSAAAAGGSMSALAGHLVYGGCLGVAFHLLEAPFGVPWLARTRAEALRALRRREELLAATPALSAAAAGHAADGAGRHPRRLRRRAATPPEGVGRSNSW